MRTIRKRVMAVCMAALLLVPGLAVLAEEMPEAEAVNEAGIPIAVSGGDVAVGTVDEAIVTETLAEDQVMVYADELAADAIASATDGNITWVIDADGKLTVNGSGNLSGNHINSNENFAWRNYRDQITSAEINVRGMTDASWLFYDCKNMISIDIRGFDTSNVTNMEYMFSGCSALENINLSTLDVSRVTDMSYMFWGCSGLTSLDFSGLDTNRVTNMGGMFDGCYRLNSLNISEFATRNVTNMRQMFSGCSGLSSIDVSGFNTENVIDMCYMFSGCSGLTSLEVSGFDTQKVTAMEGMFAHCDNIVRLDVSGFNTCNVTNMKNMFSGCSGLVSLDVSRFDTCNVKDMGGMFNYCSSLESIDVSGFNTENVTDMTTMFYDCSSLTRLDINGFDTHNVLRMTSMFCGCRKLTYLNINSFDTSNVISMAYMFSGCSSLKDLDVSGFNLSKVTATEGMFMNCSGLTSLDVSNFDTGSICYMERMFMNCSGLTSLDVSNFDTRNVADMEGLFYGCSGLSYLNISSYDADNVVDMFGMFQNCNGLNIIQSPYNVKQVILLPVVLGTVWQLSDGSEVTELPQGLSYSVTLSRRDTLTTPQITTTTPDLNMADVVRVKYVPYSYTVETNNIDTENTVTFSIVEGRLAEGLQIYPATGEIYGVPLEAGEFKIKVMAIYSNPAYLPSYAELTLTVLDNTDDNVGVATDYGYDITQPVIGFNKDVIAGENAQTLVSQGEYAQFRDVYIDGRKLTEGEEYTSAPGSTRITILNQTLANGGTGTHTLGIEFRTEDGTLKRAAQNYTISSVNTGEDPKDEDSNENTPKNEDGNSEPSVEVPINNGSNNADNSSNSNILPVPVETPQQDFIIYTVERGDSLWKIAARFYGQGSLWRRIYEDNAAVIKNPGRLYVGQKLVIRLTGMVNLMPEMPAPVSDAALAGDSYKVQKGDRLWNIARRVYGSGRLWIIIYEANKDIIADPDRIRDGQVITIPQR